MMAKIKLTTQCFRFVARTPKCFSLLVFQLIRDVFDTWKSTLKVCRSLQNMVNSGHIRAKLSYIIRLEFQGLLL